MQLNVNNLHTHKKKFYTSFKLKFFNGSFLPYDFII